MEPGTRVRRLSDGLFGTVVPDFYEGAGDGYVLIEFDGHPGGVASEVVPKDDVEVLERLTPVVSADCADCPFLNSNTCFRYAAGVAMLLGKSVKGRIPSAPYPACQQERRV